MMENNDLSLKDKVDMIFDTIQEQNQPKTKKIKIPRKAKVKKGKIKKGWVGVIKVDENGNMLGEKQKIEGSAYRTSDGSYHAINGEEVLFWEGKFPVIIQPTFKKNPLNLKKGDNETYGDKYIMARMINDATPRKKTISGSMIIWILLAIGGVYLLSTILGGG